MRHQTLVLVLGEKMVRLLILLCLAALWSSTSDAGQSLVMNRTISLNCPNIADNANYRLEFRMDNLAPASYSVIWSYLSCLDMYLSAYSNGELEILERVAGTARRFSNAARTNILVRIQRNINQRRLDIELWNVDGSGYDLRSMTGLSFATPFGDDDGNINEFPHAEGNTHLAFMRAFTTLVPLGARPPVTSDTGDYFDWKFDGNGDDASGNNRKASAGGTTFVATPNQLAVALPKTAATPAWAPFRPLRAGHPSRLDGTGSYSLADADDAVTCFWQQLPHATGEPLTSQVIFDDYNSCAPTVTGLVFGPYRFRLRVTDAAGQTSTKDLEAGAVAYDDNGVVIYPDERLYALLGPTKVYGSNDWEYPDERLTWMAQNNWNRYAVFGGTWDAEDSLSSIAGVPRSGTVHVTNGSNKLYGVGTNFLQVFCGGRVGSAITSPFGAYAAIRMPTGWREYRYQWRVASCESDTELTMIGGWQWATISSPGNNWTTFGIVNFRQDVTGTVYTDASQPTKILGTGTNFLAAFCGDKVGAAAGSPGIIVLEDALTTRKNVASCQSDTELTLAFSQTWTTSHIGAPGVAWGREATTDWGEWRANNNPPSHVNFYDIALAHYTFYYRSGWIKPRDAARFIAERWWRLSTQWGSQWRSMSLVSGILLHAVDTSYSSDLKNADEFWAQVRAKLSSGTRCVNPSTGISDVRENGYCLQFQALLAQFDPDDSSRNATKAWLVSALPTYQERQRSNGSYWGADAIPTTSTVATVSNGSTTVTLHSGAEFDANFCGVPSSFQEAGAIAVTKGSTSVIGNGTDFTGASNKRIFIRGTLGGQPYSQYNTVASVDGATSLTLRFPWPGETGEAVDYRIQSVVTAPYVDAGVISLSQSDSAGAQVLPGRVDTDNWYWCTRDSGTQLTLDKPYTGDTSSTVYRRVFRGWGGNGPTTFMQAIMAMGLWDAAKALDGYDNTAAADYRALAANVNAFMHTWVSEPYGTIGLPYLNPDGPFCQPRTVVPNACDQGDGVGTRRSYSVEAVRSFAQQFLATGDPVHKLIGDAWYTAMFSPVGFTAPFQGDGYQADLVKDGNYLFSGILLTKNYGQTFGQGGAQTWPAARLGGPAPPVPQFINVNAPVRSVEGATQVRVRVTSPSGVTATVMCDASAPCEAVVDRRQGAHWIQWEYLSADGEVLNTSEPELH
jgi:hypothetical protein